MLDFIQKNCCCRATYTPVKTVKNRRYHSKNYLASFPTHVGDLPRQFPMFGKRFPIVAGLPFTSRFTNPMLTLATSPKVDDEIQLYIQYKLGIFTVHHSNLQNQ